jgi:hypothetical protein
MRHPPSGPACDLPPWLVWLGSAAVAAHLFALIVLVLAAPSGPWPTAFGASTAVAPPFAQSLSEISTRHYLAPLKMTHNYHFTTNRPAAPEVYLEVRLKDEAGNLLTTVRVPDEGANFWARHRQLLLAQALGDDQPVEARPGETIPAPNQQVRTVEFWKPGGDRVLRLTREPEHLIPRDRPVSRPSEWSLVLARSYVRHLCRAHGAASGELIRHSREPILPAVLFMEEPPAGAFEELVSNFGELPR